MNVGVLTGGGDCPGLNAVIRAVVRRGEHDYGDRLWGFVDGWRGVLEGIAIPLDVERCRGILPRGGTILGTSRTNPLAIDGGAGKVKATLTDRAIQALVVIGGEDTLGVAHEIAADRSVIMVGVPKTIDNDLSATEVTFGFDTAVQIATDAIDRLHTTAESHHRVIVCEVMGRHAGWIATHAGIAGGAAEILIPEQPFDLDAICERLRHRHTHGRFSSIVVVAEGAKPREGALTLREPTVDPFGHERLGGIGALLAAEIERRTGYESRVSILGHIQRGGTPTAFDRVLATRLGVAAIDAAHDGESDVMVALSAGRIVRVALGEAVASLKTVDPELVDVARVFAG